MLGTIEGNRDRFKGASWFPFEPDVLVGGSGGIGSSFLFYAARVGMNLFVYDNDVVDTSNLSGQMFNESHIDMKKVDAIADVCRRFSDIEITGIPELYTEDSEANDIMVGAFDNMDARKVFYANWKAYVKSLDPEAQKKCILIDGRLEAETYQIYCVTPDTMEAYETEGLFEDADVPDAVACTLKQTSHVAGLIGGTMVSYLTNFYANIKIKRNIRHVPFFTEHSVAMGYINKR